MRGGLQTTKSGLKNNNFKRVKNQFRLQYKQKLNVKKIPPEPE